LYPLKSPVDPGVENVQPVDLCTKIEHLGLDETSQQGLCDSIVNCSLTNLIRYALSVS